MAIKWNIIYHELAHAFLVYRNQYGKEAGAEIYRTLDEDDRFRASNQWFYKYSNLTDQYIDPLILFSSLNSSRSKPENRLLRLNHLSRIFLNTQHDEVDFSGCPTPITIDLMSVRNKSTQETIWWIFENIMKFGVSFLEQEIFDKLKYIRGLDTVSFTIFLFWIDSENFLPLDKHTVGYLIQTGKIDKIPNNYEEYRRILSSPGLSFTETATIAYNFSTGENIQTEFSLTGADKEKVPVGAGNFRLLGLRPMSGLSKDVFKVLEIGYAYTFYQAFDLNNFQSIGYNPEMDILLYSVKELKISISSIVGKNGKGKSTLTELIYMAVNVLARAHGNISTVLRKINGFNLELYYIADFLHCIRFTDSEVVIYRYERIANSYVNPTIIPLDQFDLNQFFYTIAVNYSLYGLNSAITGKWIDYLFVKNDGYQVPIAINPYRKRGNIDVNIEQVLTRQRLMVNLLLPYAEEDGLFDLRKLTDKSSAVSVSYQLNGSKFKSLYSYKKDRTDTNDVIVPFQHAARFYHEVLAYLCKKFDLDEKLIPADVKQRNTLIDYAFWYILQKLISISRSYDLGYFDVEAGLFLDHRALIDFLSGNYSHITNKLRQAINFIKYSGVRVVLSRLDLSAPVPLSIAELSNEIAKTITESDESELDTVHMIPPAFLIPTIILDDGSSLDDLSSGEKQRIYAVNSLIYHLYNLNSVSNHDDLVSYRYVNIIFDEIELYFHPEMQQDFINYLLLYLERINLDRIAAINILIVTHSPFILSDIPSTNILFLGKTDQDIRTFGSNIHDLLANSFFMEAFMGNYVKKVIGELVDYLNPMVEDPLGWSEERSIGVIEQIGEPLIRRRLKEMYLTRFKKEISLQAKIAQMKQELQRLEDEANS
ncbi:AAA family ATPase [Pedobacter miscanthi]|uniref:AAA family ATPase n=1 Tax=Pedobacter miscanthi TaxID=2259170 RepID=UPI002931D983|nr:AAA family ATPase [Pedobacter miscanthi]